MVASILKKRTVKFSAYKDLFSLEQNNQKNNHIAAKINGKRFSDDIRMQFGLDSCAKVTFWKGLQVKSKDITLNINTEIIELEHNKTNEYLGINKANSINHIMNKEKG